MANKRLVKKAIKAMPPNHPQRKELLDKLAASRDRKSPKGKNSEHKRVRAAKNRAILAQRQEEQIKQEEKAIEALFKKERIKKPELYLTLLEEECVQLSKAPIIEKLETIISFVKGNPRSRYYAETLLAKKIQQEEQDKEEKKQQLRKKRQGRRDNQAKAKEEKNNILPGFRGLNGIGFPLAENGDELQYYKTKYNSSTGQKTLYTSMAGVSSLTQEQVDDLKKILTIQNTKECREQFTQAVFEIVQEGKRNKTETLTVVSQFSTSFKLTKESGLFASTFTRPAPFPDREDVITQITKPQDYRIKTCFDFCQDFATHNFEDQNDFISFIKQNDNLDSGKYLQTDSEQTLTEKQMISKLEELGYVYEYDEELTVEDFVDIQRDILKIEGDKIVKAKTYGEPTVHLDEGLATLRSITNETVKRFFEENEIACFSHHRNPHLPKPNKKRRFAKIPEVKTIPPITVPFTNPAKDPRAAINHVIARYALDNKMEALFSTAEVEKINQLGFGTMTEWPVSTSPAPSKERRNYLRKVM